MRFCDKPTRNDEERGYLNPAGVPWRAPSLQDGDEILFDECGRCAPQVNGKGQTDYHSYHFRLVRNVSMYSLLVRHGGGDERIPLGHDHTRIAEILWMLDSDARYLMMHALYGVHRDAKERATAATRREWSQAAVDGRIKKRKKRGQDLVDVWIEPAMKSAKKE